MSSRRCARRAATLLAALVAFAATAAVGVAAGGPVAGAAKSTGPSLVIDAQSEWVEPTGTATTAPFDLALTATGAPTTAVLSIRLFRHIHYLSTLHNDESSPTGPSGAGLTTTITTVALSSLKSDATVTGAVDLDINVATSATAAESAPAPAVDLSCTVPTCPGIYPVQIVLSDGAGTQLAKLTTFCTYSNDASTHPLDFALVLPVTASIGESTTGDPLHAIQKLSASEVNSLGTLVDQIHGTSGVDLTLEPSPETLERLGTAKAGGQSTVTTLGELSENQADTEVPAQPYVPVDLSSLAGAGEGTEVAAQMNEGQGVLKQLGVQTTPSKTGVWVAADAGTGLTTGLAEIGATDLVVPNSDLTTTTHDTETALTYALASGAAAGSAARLVAPADPTVSAEFSDTSLLSTDPALAATDLLADVAFVHFEAPYTEKHRGVVGVPPQGWQPNATFDQQLLSGLAGNPVIKSVTLTEFFKTVTQTKQAGRQLTSTQKTAASAPLLKTGTSQTAAKALTANRLQLTGFDAAVATSGHAAVTILTKLDRLLLCSETTSDPGSGDRRTVVRRLAVFHRALTGQTSQVTIVGEHDGGQQVTLTARTGFIPVTVLSKLPYHVRGMLTVSGDKFEFITNSGKLRQKTASHEMTLLHTVNPWRFDVRARSSGGSPLIVAFTADNGALHFATENLSVRSTATSLAGILLTALALAVLLAWWARTWLSGRRRRQGGHTDGARAEA